MKPLQHRVHRGQIELFGVEHPADPFPIVFVFFVGRGRRALRGTVRTRRFHRSLRVGNLTVAGTSSRRQINGSLSIRLMCSPITWRACAVPGLISRRLRTTPESNIRGGGDVADIRPRWPHPRWPEPEGTPTALLCAAPAGGITAVPEEAVARIGFGVAAPQHVEAAADRHPTCWGADARNWIRATASERAICARSREQARSLIRTASVPPIRRCAISRYFVGACPACRNQAPL
jgi:hypothetical protein